MIPTTLKANRIGRGSKCLWLLNTEMSPLVAATVVGVLSMLYSVQTVETNDCPLGTDRKLCRGIAQYRSTGMHLPLFKWAIRFAILGPPLSLGSYIFEPELLYPPTTSAMSLNPLAPVTDYQSMLNRIFWFTSASALVAIWMLRLYIPGLDRLLREIDFTVAFGGDKILPMPGGYILPALSVGILTRIYRMHARISDWLGIRECFDIDVIIGELATQLAIDITPIRREQLVDCRNAMMRRSFYAYVSGPRPQIDPQLTQQALDAWSWFWVGVEASFVFALGGLGLIAGGAYQVGLQTIGGTLILAAIGLPAMRGQCKRYAIAQVRAIVLDPARAAAVRAAFAELTGNRFAIRKAA